MSATWELAAVPTEALAAELYRRGIDPLSCVQDVRLPGLTIRPSHYLVTWGGQDVLLRPRQMDVLLVLARSHPNGVTTARVAHEVYGAASASHRQTIRVFLYELRRRLPGLLNEQGGNRGGQPVAVYSLAGVESAARRDRVRVVWGA